MSSPYYQKGNTVKLTGQFYDWGSALVDPESVKLLILDGQYKTVKTVTQDEIQRLGVGEYRYFYVADTVGTFYYEWYGTIGGLPSLKRRSIIVKII